MRHVPRWLNELGNSPDAVFAVDETQRILTWNRAAEKVFGLPASDAIGRFCYDVVGGRLRSGRCFCRPDCLAQQTVRRGDTCHAFELQTRNARGERSWVDVSVTTLSTSRGPLALHTLRVDRPRDRSEDAIGEIVETLTAHGLVPKPSPTEEAAQDSGHSNSQPNDPLAALSPREQEVLALLTRGCSTEQIAGTLGVSVLTARCHIRNMLRKARAHSRTELVSLALRPTR